MNWQQRLNTALSYIETHLEDRLELESIAAVACCSQFHFMRVFEVVSGIGVGDYIRRRRLSQAALALSSGREKVIDVALRYGYDTPEAFAKAFKRLFGITPSEATKPGVLLTTFPPLTVSVVLKGSQAMQYRMHKQENAITMSGLGIRVCKHEQQHLKDIPAFWQQSVKNGAVSTLWQSSGPMGMLGICHEWSNETEEFSYLIAIDKPEDKTLPLEGLRELVLPAGQYAVFGVEGQLPGAIQKAWQRIYNEWFPNSGYEHAGSPDFERYPPFALDDPRGDPASPHCITEIWIPLRRAD